jgi:hypothetical protein
MMWTVRRRHQRRKSADVLIITAGDPKLPLG